MSRCKSKRESSDNMQNLNSCAMASCTQCINLDQCLSTSPSVITSVMASLHSISGWSWLGNAFVRSGFGMQGVTGSEPSSSGALESFEPKENDKAGVETVPVGCWSERNKDEGDKSPLMAVARDGDLSIIGWRWSQTGSAPRHELSAGRQGSIEDGELA